MNFVSLLGATAPPASGRDYACRSNDSSLCHGAWNLFHDVDTSHAVDVFSQIITALVILLVAVIAQRLTRRLIKRVISGLQGEKAQRRLMFLRRATPNALLITGQTSTLRRAQRADTIGALLRSITAVVIFIVAAIAILNLFDLPLGSLIAGASVTTAVLAFGAQNIIRDFLAGFFIVVEDQYGVGDVIDVGTVAGSVESVSLRITQIRTEDGTLWHVPNGEIKAVGNKSQNWSRAVTDIRITLDSDITKAIDVLKAALDELWHDPAYSDSLIEPPEVWGPEEINSKGILLKVGVKTKPAQQWRISRTLRSRVKTALDAAGIRIAVPIADQVAPDPNASPIEDDEED